MNEARANSEEGAKKQRGDFSGLLPDVSGWMDDIGDAVQSVADTLPTWTAADMFGELGGDNG